MSSEGGFGELGGGQSYDEMFTPADEERDGHVWLISGGQGTGKTYTTQSSFPEPIFVIDTELRADITANELPDRDIRIFEPGSISFEDVDPDNPLEDAIDVTRSLDNINNAVVQLVKGYKEGEIEGGTVLMDSATDLWSWCQEWGKQRLMRENEVNEATFRLDNQFDWGMIKNKHARILNGLTTLSKKYGAEVVFTAREKEIPDYADGGGEHYIKVENRVPFAAEVQFRMTTEVRKGKNRHIADFSNGKLGANNQPTGEIVDPTYDQLIKALSDGEVPDDWSTVAEDTEEDEESGF